jgi:Ca-activated chloride channel family protein
VKEFQIFNLTVRCLPWVLALLLVLPPALYLFLWWSARKRRELMSAFVQARLLPDLTAGLAPERERWTRRLLVTTLTLTIIALARPQWGFTWEESKQKGLDVIVAIDTSKSMLAEDIAPNRLARAKLAALDLMGQAKSDRLGLVAFAGVAFLSCPMTFDDAAFRQSVDSLDVNTMPQGGTALAEAIHTAAGAFKEGDNYKVLVLFTDGEDQDTGAVDAAKQAAESGVRIFTVGIGSGEGTLLSVRDGKGRTDYIRDEAGNPVMSKLNEKLLNDIAAAGNGFYLPLKGAKAMETLYANGLAPLPKTEEQTKLYKRYHEQYHWFLALAVLLLIVEFLLPNRARVKQASKSNVINGTKPVKVAAVIFALGVMALSASATPATAMKDFRAGKFAEAQKEFERLITLDKKGDLRLTFNAGVAAYRGTNYDAAITHFNNTLTAKDVKLQQAAYFNLGNCHFSQGTEAKDLDGMQEKWEVAVKDFQNAVELDKTDKDAAHNLEFAKRCVQQIVALREAAKRAKEAADSATRERNYHQAYEIMQQLLQTNPAAKQFEEFVKKLKDIDDIVTPHQP